MNLLLNLKQIYPPHKKSRVSQKPSFLGQENRDTVYFGRQTQNSKNPKNPKKFVMGWVAKLGLIIFVPGGVFVVIALERERIKHWFILVKRGFRK